MAKYIPKSVESKWQKYWQTAPKKAANRGKYYILDMFPYPSGDGLHVGHVENFTATDILSRYQRLQGYDVIHPMGWDAFGLPAENFAIKTGVHPDIKTKESIANFKRQIQSVGLSYDWEREVNTSSPEYYRWTQWVFLFLYEQGLAYRKKAKVNWCPSCQTVLANEQVIDGKCDRSGDVVVQKDLEQWFFRITDLVEDTKSVKGEKIHGLLSGLDTIDWPESTKAAQRHWVGRSEGVEVKFPIVGTQDAITVFTTRLDTIYGCSYVVVAPEHTVVQNLADPAPVELTEYLAASARKTNLERTELNKDKTGVRLPIEVAHPFTGERLPVYVADYVLGSYGTGAVMGVPAHDERDYEFAQKYSLPIVDSVAPYFVATHPDYVYRPEYPTKEALGITGLLHDVEKDLYLILEGKQGFKSFINGASEKDESPEETFRRETLEETGYNIKDIRPITSSFRSSYCKFWKEVNLESTVRSYYATLENTVPELVSEEEKSKNTVSWWSATQVEEFLALADSKGEDRYMRYVWEHHQSGAYPYTDDGILIASGKFTGLTSDAARTQMAEWLEGEGLGMRKVNYRLRDWLVSRQRYWGAPIPMVYCAKCVGQTDAKGREYQAAHIDDQTYALVPVPLADLPVQLPTDVDFRPTGESPLVRSESFHRVACPNCGGTARRESDTMDTFVCSSWYYMRFLDSQNSEEFASPKALQSMPVDFYMGGAEHTVLHLLYARFVTKALARAGLLDCDEPFAKLRHQGMILGPDGRKMSKSYGNVINPDSVVGEYGADTLRLYEMFMGPIDEMKPWKPESVVGMRRFLERIWKVGNREIYTEGESDVVDTMLHQTIAKVTDDIANLRFNTAISQMMICLGTFEEAEDIALDTWQTYLVLLYPLAPHIASELWETLGAPTAIEMENWPIYDSAKLVAQSVTLGVQVNGKVRGNITLAPDASQEVAEALARSDAHVAEYLAAGTVAKVVYVPGRILSFVVR
jgi:leucyl-tRNA synthetase